MDNKKLKVLLTTNIPAPYMVDYLDCLGKKCDLTVLFEMGSAKDRTSQWYGKVKNRAFKTVFLDAKAITAEAGLSFKIIKYLKKGYDKIIIANPTTPTGIIALLYCRMKNIHFLLQSEGGFRGSEKGIKEKFKKFLMEKADLYLSGMKGESDYFFSYGATEKTLRWYPFTSLHEEQIDKKVISKKDKESLRKELNIIEEKVVLSVGRAIYRKGFDALLNAKKGMADLIGMYFVGTEITKEYQEIIEKNNLQNVHFINHCCYEQLVKYYHAADVFVLPTREDTWGLVINEAMANGLPIITTDRCVAGLQLIENNINGYIIPVDDEMALIDKVNYLISNERLCYVMGKNNLEKIKPYYIENMAECIYNIIQE